MPKTTSTYTVELWQTAMPWPLSFFVHTWFVIETQGALDRYEVWATLGKFFGSTVVKKAIAPRLGFRRSFFDDPIHPTKLTAAHCCGSVSGRSGSDVEKLYLIPSPTNHCMKNSKIRLRNS